MSTRATITVSDDQDSFDIYQHHDGYPDGPYGLVRHISTAQQLAWEPPRFEAADFAAAVIAVLKDRGGSTYLTTNAEAHTDRTYHYHVEPIRNKISAHVQLTITQPAWRTQDPDNQIFQGSIQDAVLKFNAVPDVSDLSLEHQILTQAEATLCRAEEEICQWFKGTPNEDTRNTLEDIDDASRNLMRLRHHLEKNDPWHLLQRIEKILTKVDGTNAGRSINQLKVETTLALGAHRRFQR